MGQSTLKPEGVQPDKATAGGKTAYEDLGEGAVAGNLTADPELRYTPSGNAIAALRVAETPRIKDPETQAWVDGETTFWDVIAHRGQAERCAEYLRKGDRIVAVGVWQRQTWQDKDGAEREAVKLSARDVGASLLFTEVRVNRAKRRQQP